MNVVFLTMAGIKEVKTSGIYQDLMQKFRDGGHKVFIVSPCERRFARSADYADGADVKDLGKSAWLLKADGVTILRVRTLNLQKANVIEKGIGQLSVETLFKKAIKKHLGNIKFALILYSTPPITFPKVIDYLKKKNPEAKSYLLLKDIFPQNAVDLGMLPGASFKFRVSSFKSWVDLGKYQLYKMFKRKEKRLYALSDYIGCMSPANVRYVIEHNPEVSPEKVEVAPNSYSSTPTLLSREGEANLQPLPQGKGVREKYELPTDKPIFIYGGNLGKPQGIDFLIECLKANANREDCCFVVVGDGTEFHKLESQITQMGQMTQRGEGKRNIWLFRRLPKEDYDELVRSCDVGLIFLDYRFTIPNYPSRLLPYLMEKKPIIAATDLVSDIGSIAEENGYGYWCQSNSVEAFTKCVDEMLQSDIKKMGEAGYKFFLNNYTVENTFKAVMQHFDEHEYH